MVGKFSTKKAPSTQMNLRMRLVAGLVRRREQATNARIIDGVGSDVNRNFA